MLWETEEKLKKKELSRIEKAQNGTKSLYQSITADGPETYVDGYGTIREIHESPIVTGLRKFHHWINMDRTLSDEAYLQKHGYQKPLAGLGAAGMASKPNFVIKTLPDGTKIKVIAEGVSGATKRAKSQMSTIDRYMKGRTDTQLAADEIISAMRNKGLPVDEQEIFTNVARGNAAIYSKYLK